MEMIMINDKGLKAIREFLNQFHKNPNLLDTNSDSKVWAFAAECEFQFENSGGASCELTSTETNTGHVETLELTEDEYDLENICEN
jgi:hypothetical protein